MQTQTPLYNLLMNKTIKNYNKVNKYPFKTLKIISNNKMLNL
jgi:hypothetical protein